MNTEKASLSEKVAIASQLDAIGISIIPKDKRGHSTQKVTKCKVIQVNFSLAKNVTAANGMRTIYVRISSPTGSVLGNAGTFEYENKNLQASMTKSVEYGGKETPVTMYWNVTEALVSGTYVVSIFADNNMIGSKSYTFK